MTVSKKNGTKKCYQKPTAQLRKFPEPVVKGILQHDSDTRLFSVLYSQEGYAATLDQPLMGIRLVGTEEWLHWSVAPLEDWIGKPVELRCETEQRGLDK